MEQTKYDVFISYSRKDYVKNDEIIPGNPITAIQEIFEKNGVKYWFDKDGIYSGEEFVKEISNAIVNSKMLVFVSSKNSNKSEYTCGEILKAKKAKKLIIPFLIDECEYNEKFEILLLPLNHIDYVSQPNTAFPELLRTVEKEKEKIKLIEQSQANNHQIEQTKKVIAAGIKDFQRLSGEQDFLLRSLYSKSKEIGVKTKMCPVCEAEMPIDAPFCESCGWHFALLYGVYGVDGKSLHNEKHLSIVRGLWQDLIEGKDSVARLKEVTASLEEKRREMNQKMANTLCELASIKEELTNTQERYDISEKGKDELQNYFECQISELKKQIDIAELELAKEKQKAEERRKAEDQAKGITFNVGGVPFKMIRVEGGSFMMGAPNNDSEALRDEKPQHRVTLSDYYIGETVVTQSLWQAVKGDNPSHWKGDSLPVEMVSWDDCQDFINLLNKKTNNTFRLPTEAEWEYAARDRCINQGGKYGISNDLDKVAWYHINSGGRTHPVKLKSANELGVYDMSGNVWEWCQDRYGEYSDVSQTNPFGASSGSRRVVRGGCWFSNARICRVVARNSATPGHSYDYIGFRLALVHL